MKDNNSTVSGNCKIKVQFSTTINLLARFTFSHYKPSRCLLASILSCYLFEWATLKHVSVQVFNSETTESGAKRPLNFLGSECMSRMSGNIKFLLVAPTNPNQLVARIYTRCHLRICIFEPNQFLTLIQDWQTVMVRPFSVKACIVLIFIKYSIVQVFVVVI